MTYITLLLLLTGWSCFASGEDTSKGVDIKKFTRDIKSENFVKGPSLYADDIPKNGYAKKISKISDNVNDADDGKFASDIKGEPSRESPINDDNTKGITKSSNTGEDTSKEISKLFRNFKRKGFLDGISKFVKDLNDVTKYRIIKAKEKESMKKFFTPHVVPNPDTKKHNFNVDAWSEKFAEDLLGTPEKSRVESNTNIGNENFINPYTLKKDNIVNSNVNRGDEKFVHDLPDPNMNKKNSLVNSNRNTRNKNFVKHITDPDTKKKTMVDPKTFTQNAKFLRDLTDLADYELWQASQNDNKKLTIPQMKKLVSNFYKIKNNDIVDTTSTEQVERFITYLNDSTNAEIKAAGDILRIRRNDSVVDSNAYEQNEKTADASLGGYIGSNSNYLPNDPSLNNLEFSNYIDGGTPPQDVYSTQNDYSLRLKSYLNADRSKNLTLVNYLNNSTNNVPIDLNDIDNNNNNNNNNNDDKYSDSSSNSNADESNIEMINADKTHSEALKQHASDTIGDEIYSRVVAEKGFKLGKRMGNEDLDADLQSRMNDPDDDGDVDGEDYLGVADESTGIGNNKNVVDVRSDDPASSVTNATMESDLKNLHTLFEVAKKDEKNSPVAKTSSVAKTSITNAVRNVLNIVEETDDRNNGNNKGNSSLVNDGDKSSFVNGGDNIVNGGDNRTASTQNLTADNSLTEFVADIKNSHRVGFVDQKDPASTNGHRAEYSNYHYDQQHSSINGNASKERAEATKNNSSQKHEKEFGSANVSRLENSSSLMNIKVPDEQHIFSNDEDKEDFKENRFDRKNHPNIYLKTLDGTTSGVNKMDELSPQENGDNGANSENKNQTEFRNANPSQNNKTTNDVVDLPDNGILSNETNNDDVKQNQISSRPPSKYSDDLFTYGQPFSEKNIERNELNKKWFNVTSNRGRTPSLHDTSDLLEDDYVDEITDDNDGNFIENDDDDNTVDYVNVGNQKSIFDTSYTSRNKENKAFGKIKIQNSTTNFIGNQGDRFVGNENEKSVFDVNNPPGNNANKTDGRMKIHNASSSFDNNSDKTIKINIQNGSSSFDNNSNKTSTMKIHNSSSSFDNNSDKTIKMKIQNGALSFDNNPDKTSKMKIQNGITSLDIYSDKSSKTKIHNASPSFDNNPEDKFVTGIDGDMYSSNTQKERIRNDKVRNKFLKGVTGDAERLSDMSSYFAGSNEHKSKKDSEQNKQIIGYQNRKKCNESTCARRTTNDLTSNSDKLLNGVAGDVESSLILKQSVHNIKGDNLFLKGVAGDAERLADVGLSSASEIGIQRNISVYDHGKFDNNLGIIKLNNNTGLSNAKLSNNSTSFGYTKKLNDTSNDANVKQFNNEMNPGSAKKLANASNISFSPSGIVNQKNGSTQDAHKKCNTNCDNVKQANDNDHLDSTKLLNNTANILNVKPSNLSTSLDNPKLNVKPSNFTTSLDNPKYQKNSTSLDKIDNSATVNLQSHERPGTDADWHWTKDAYAVDGGKKHATNLISDGSRLLGANKFLTTIDGDAKRLVNMSLYSSADIEQFKKVMASSLHHLVRNCSGDCRDSLLQNNAEKTDRHWMKEANEDVYGQNDDEDLIKEMAMEEIKAKRRIEYNKDLIKDSAELQRRYYAQLSMLDPESAKVDVSVVAKSNKDNPSDGIMALDGTIRNLQKDTKKIPIIGTPRGDPDTFEINGLNYHNLVRNIHDAPSMKIDAHLSEKAAWRAREIAAEAGGSSTDSITQKPGENVFIGCYSENLTALHATKKWYNEICVHGYDFDKIGPQYGTNQFAQVVWKESTLLGIGRDIATAQNGTNCTFIVALYKEPGNRIGSYKKNVKRGTFSSQTCKDLNKIVPGEATVNNHNSTSSHVKRRTVDNISNDKSGAEPDFAEDGLRTHNTFRNIHGSQKMELDSALTNAANEFAMKLAAEDLSTGIPESSGENVFKKCASEPATAREATKEWYSEVCGFDFEHAQNHSEKRSHFRRVIRKASNLLGMGIATKKLHNGTICSFIVARYNPPENEEEENIFNIRKGLFTVDLCGKLEELSSPRKSVNQNNVENRGGINNVNDKEDNDDISAVSPFVKEGCLAHNRYRRIHDSSLMTIDPLLSNLARKKAKELSKMDPTDNIRSQPGENIFMRCASKASTAKEAVDTWYSEVCDPPSYNFKRQEKFPARIHFAQVVWDESNIFGMGRANKKAKNGSICSYIVARYNPPGNSGDKNKNVRKGEFDEEICIGLSSIRAIARFAIPPYDIIAEKRSPQKNLFFNERLKGDDGIDDEGDDSKNVVLSSFEREALKAHNAFRKLHGAQKLVIDTLLSDSAQNDANKLANGVLLEADKAGRNTLIRCSSEAARARAATEEWYREVCTGKYDFNEARYQSNAHHFTQLVWNETSLLGIGRVTKQSDNGSVCSFIVAHYNPPGNQGNFKMNVLIGEFTDNVCSDITSRSIGVSNENSRPIGVSGGYSSLIGVSDGDSRSIGVPSGDSWSMTISDAEKLRNFTGEKDFAEKMKFKNITEDGTTSGYKDVEKINLKNFTGNTTQDPEEIRLKNFTENSPRDEVTEKIKLNNFTKNMSGDPEKITENTAMVEDAGKKDLNNITVESASDDAEKIELNNTAENSLVEEGSEKQQLKNFNDINFSQNSEDAFGKLKMKQMTEKVSFEIDEDSKEHKLKNFAADRNSGDGETPRLRKRLRNSNGKAFGDDGTERPPLALSLDSS